ncbi:hypothetical protein Tco_0274649 [Tanacetum coccineum]
MVVIWNPSIRKSIGVALPKYRHDLWIGYQRVYGFGVCPLTSDPTVIEVLCADNMPWHVEVFTLSSGVWNVIQSGNLPRQSIKINSSGQVVIDRESLVVYKDICVARGGVHCGVWVMDHDSSFRKLFTIGAPVKIAGFKENGETIYKRRWYTKLDVYDPCSQQIKNLGISEK